MKQKSISERGFTLIELMITLSIIGLLSGTLITTYVTTRNKATDSRRQSDLSQLRDALEIYSIDNSGYPNTFGNWYGLASSATAGFKNLTGPNGYIPNLAPTYLVQLPQDPSGDTSNWSGYLYKSDGTNYKLLSNSNGPKSFPNAGDYFYDPARPTTAWMVTNNEGATSTCPTPATCW